MIKVKKHTYCIRHFNVSYDDISLVSKDEQSNTIVYYGNSDKCYNKRDCCKKLLSKEEVNRMNGFVYERDRLTYCLSHGLLRNALSNRFGLSAESLDIRFFDGVKPYVKNVDVDFNLSHSKNNFSYAHTNNSHIKVGVDIEKREDIMDIVTVVENSFHPNEVEYMNVGDLTEKQRQVRFYEIWTRKEAFLKMLGTGILEDLPALDMTCESKFIEINLAENLSVLKGDIYIFTLAIKDFVLSVSSNFPHKPCFREIGQM
ncbi:4'-phosphopantetheinyl transferase family protein [Saccharicrinis sp. GN24d3]|uniref:4'-phosphopantetheinyl transferase family protein n=1 Tax=Saccharicrinis sp. GN24d3 TaxID=3458416 RepID=UPI004035A98E